MTVIANGHHGWNRNGPWLNLERVWRSAMHSGVRCILVQYMPPVAAAGGA
jgi:hypothetical protein